MCNSVRSRLQCISEDSECACRGNEHHVDLEVGRHFCIEFFQETRNVNASGAVADQRDAWLNASRPEGVDLTNQRRPAAILRCSESLVDFLLNPVPNKLTRVADVEFAQNLFDNRQVRSVVAVMSESFNDLRDYLDYMQSEGRDRKNSFGARCRGCNVVQNIWIHQRDCRTSYHRALRYRGCGLAGVNDLLRLDLELNVILDFVLYLRPFDRS